MTKPQTPAHGSGKPALSQKAEERKLRADAERGAAGGLPTSVLLMGLAGSAVAASGRLPHEKSGPAAQDAPSQAPQDPALPGAAEAEVSSSQLVSDAAQASMVDGQALQQIVADLVTEAASVAMPGAGQVAAQAGPEGAALTEGSAAEAAAAESAAAQAAQVAVEAVEAAMAAAGAEGIASPPMLLAQAQVPAASAGAASSSAASAATAAGAGASAGAAAGTAAAATATAATAAAAGAAVSTAALLAVGAVVVGAAVASSGSDSSPTPETPADKTAPTLTITDDKTGTVNAAGGNITYTFTFSEAVTGFTAADVTVANGTKGTFTAVSSTVYTLVVTPTAGFEGNVTVDVAASAASDAAGNASTAAAQSVQAVDTKAATVAITDNQSATTTNGAITYTFTFSEAVTGFTADDVTVANGTKGTFTAVSSTVYTLVVTPTAGFEGNVTVDVAASAASDAVGNASAAAAQSVQAVDTKAPTVAITDNQATTTNGAITYTFTFSEAVTGFTAADVTVANGTKGTFTAVSSTVYTLVVTPTAGFEGNVTVDVAASAASDAVGNASAAAAQSVQAVDTKAPTVAITDNQATTTNGAITYTFTFSEAVTGFTAADVTVANGTKGTFTAVSSTVYTLVVTPTAGFEGNVTVDVAASAASDAAGNASTAAAQSVQAVDTKAATVAITDNQSATTTNGAITYTFTFSEAVTGFTADDVTVANGTKGTFTAVSSTVYTLVVTPTAG
ncbi:MAG: Ig-like domain-containing protein, partial [Betaproteobacteria bacterium]